MSQQLKQLDDLGIADNTIVIWSTENGAETFSWPDGGTTPFHGEKGTTWEGGFRVPLLVRWPGVIKPGIVYNDIIAQEDWMPTLLVNLRADPYEKGPNEADLGYLRRYGDNLWTFVPVQIKIKEFLATLQGFPFQEGSSLNAAGINYTSLRAAEIVKPARQGLTAGSGYQM